MEAVRGHSTLRIVMQLLGHILKRQCPSKFTHTSTLYRVTFENLSSHTHLANDKV